MHEAIVRSCYVAAMGRYIAWFYFFSSRRRHTRFDCDWSSDVCSSDLLVALGGVVQHAGVQIVHHPVVRDGHVGEERLAFDEHDPVLAKKPIRPAVVDEGDRKSVV